MHSEGTQTYNPVIFKCMSSPLSSWKYFKFDDMFTICLVPSSHTSLNKDSEHFYHTYQIPGVEIGWLGVSIFIPIKRFVSFDLSETTPVVLVGAQKKKEG